MLRPSSNSRPASFSDYMGNKDVLKDYQISRMYPEEKSSGDRMQNERREFKYIIPTHCDQTVASIRRFIMCHLEPDEFTAMALARQVAEARGELMPTFNRLKGAERTRYSSEFRYCPEINSLKGPGIGYLVHSIYLDNYSRATVWQTEQGLKNRFKLRIRFYDNDPNGVASLEVKERRNQIILKSRAFVPKKIAEEFLNKDGFRISDSHLVNNTYKEREGLVNFMERCEQLGAKPSRYTSYYREGYENPENNEVRVTFDRDVRGARYQKCLDASHRETWRLVEFGGTVLELKFCENPPWWMSYLCQEYDLERGTAAKYVGSVLVTDHEEE